MTLTGDNGLLTRTVGAKNKTTLAGMEEELNLTYMSVYTGKAGGGAINSGVSLDEIYNDASLPSEVKSHIIQRGNVGTIRLKSPSQNNITILVESGAITSNGTAGSNTVSIEVEEVSNDNAYWLESEGKYYPMIIENSRVKIDKENASTTNPTETAGQESTENAISVTFIDSGADGEADASSYVTKNVSKEGAVTTITLTATGAGSTQLMVKKGNGTEAGEKIEVLVTVKPVYEINIGSMTNGSVGIKTNNIDTPSNAKYASGVQILLKATGSQGYAFEKWNDDTAIITNPRSIEVNATTSAVEYTATFKETIGYFKTVDGVARYYESESDTIGIPITSENMGQYLGRKVKYTPGNAGSASYGTSTDYRLFYVDVGTGANGKYGDGQGTIYLKADCDSKSANWSAYKQYDSGKDGSESSSDNRVIMFKLNPGMNGNVLNDDHDCGVAWMTDPAQWSDWKDGTIKLDNDSTVSGINYVVGGPSLEMYVDSYNAYLDSHTENNIVQIYKNGSRTEKAEQLDCEYVTSGYDAIGYRIGFKNTAKVNWANTGYFQENNSLFAYNSENGQQMYNPGSMGSYWLVSPSASTAQRILCAWGAHSIVSLNYTYNRHAFGFCPLVSIKSGVSISEKK